MGYGYLFVGPSEEDGYIPLPPKLYVIYIGEFISGITSPFIYIPIMPEFIIQLKLKFKDYPEDIISDIAAAIYNFFIGFGTCLGNINN